MVMDTTKPVLRQLADGDLGRDDYEALQLWLIPILLRSRETYYADAVQAVEHEIEEAWTRYQHLYPSRTDFDNSDFINSFWQRASPYWWGLNDVVGFIDIRANVRTLAIDATLFLTAKRPSRKLVDKTFVARGQRSLPLGPGQSNADLVKELDDIVTDLRSDPRLRKRYVDLDSWRRVVANTNLLRIVLGEIRREAS